MALMEERSPHALLSTPNPIAESHVRQSFSLFPRIPTLALRLALVLNPSWLQLGWRWAFESVSAIHLFRPSEVDRYWPSAIREWREEAWLLITVNLNCPLTFIPRQTLEKGVFQYVCNLVSCESKPVVAPVTIAVITTIIRMIMVYSMEPTRWLFICQNYLESYSSHEIKWVETASNCKIKSNK